MVRQKIIDVGKITSCGLVNKSLFVSRYLSKYLLVS